MSGLNSDAKRQVHHCRACGTAIFILLRTDRRYCTDACRKWWRRHPGVRRVYAGRGMVRLPQRPGWGRPKTLAEALTLLAETRAYATKLQAAAEALTHELTQREGARAQLQDELNRERTKAEREHEALSEVQERAQAAEQRATEQEKELASLKAELQRIKEVAMNRESARAADEPRVADRPISEEQNRTGISRWDRDERDRHSTVGLLGSIYRRRRYYDGEDTSARQDPARPPGALSGAAQAAPIPPPGLITELRQQVASLTEELERARRHRREERNELLDEMDGHKGELRRLDRRLQRAMEEREEWVREKQALTRSREEQHTRWESESAQFRRELAARERERDALNATLRTLTEEHMAEREIRTKLESKLAEQEREQDELGRRVASLHSERVHLATKNTFLTGLCSQWKSKAEQASADNQAASETNARLVEELATRNRETTEQKEQIASLMKASEDLTSKNKELEQLRQNLLGVCFTVERRHRETMQKLQAERATEATNQERVVQEQREQIASLTQDIEQLRAANAELSRSRDEHKQHAEHAHDLLKTQEKQKIQTVNRVLERVREESKAVLGSAERTLEIERERRQAVEAMNDELRRELSRAEQAALGKDAGSAPVWTAPQRDSVLLRELVALRKHRDGMVSERDLLARRLLRLMEPGQYLAHATTANYDPVTDPLIELKRREVRVENEKRELQEARKKSKRARKRDPEQTLDEQAYASAIASRWHHIDRPHSRREPRWHIVGYLLDDDSERYLRTLVEKRIAQIERQLSTESMD